MAKARKDKRKSRREPKKDWEPDDTKIQRQIYITQGLIESLEKLRVLREAEIRNELGDHISLSWSGYVGSVLHELARNAKESGKI